MKKLKKSQGITLIALVITIIVLILLAGISIQSLTGSGIFGKAKEAIEKHKYEVALEKVKLAVNGAFDETGNINDTYLHENLDNIQGKESLIESEDKESFIVKVDGYEFIVSKSSGEIIKKEIEIADEGDVESSREIDEEEYKALKNTVEIQNEIISAYSNTISDLQSSVEILQNRVDTLSNSATYTGVTTTLLGTTTKNNILNLNLTGYKKINVITCYTTLGGSKHKGSIEIVVDNLTTEGEYFMNGERNYSHWWHITKSSLQTTDVSTSSNSFIDSATTYVYGIK